MSFKRHEVGQSQQRMHDAAVADEDFRRTDLALPDIREPRLQLTDHERSSEDVQMALDRRVSFAERSADLGRVPDLPVVVGQHHPQAAQGRRRNLHAELGNVALEKRADEVLPPAHALAVVAGQEGARKTAPQPELAQRCNSSLAQIEAPHFDEADPARERFRTVSHELG